MGLGVFRQAGPAKERTTWSFSRIPLSYPQRRHTSISHNLRQLGRGTSGTPGARRVIHTSKRLAEVSFQWLGAAALGGR